MRGADAGTSHDGMSPTPATGQGAVGVGLATPPSESRSMVRPVDLPPIDIRAFWHAKVHQDPANRWLRELIVGQFGQAGGSGH